MLAGTLACDPAIYAWQNSPGPKPNPWGIAYPEGVRLDIKWLPRLEPCAGWPMVCVSCVRHPLSTRLWYREISHKSVWSSWQTLNIGPATQQRHDNTVLK